MIVRSRILWFLLLVCLGALLWWLGSGCKTPAWTPPVPPTPKPTEIRAIVPPKPAQTNVFLYWAKWWGSSRDPASNCVHIVRACKTNRIARPQASWPVLAITPSNWCVLPKDKATQFCWFTVTRSNVVRHTESGVAVP